MVLPKGLTNMRNKGGNLIKFHGQVGNGGL